MWTHPSFGAAIISRVLEMRCGHIGLLLPQPDRRCDGSILCGFGRPPVRPFW
ncbi:MAG: hypothetical protein ACLT1K_00620 [[Clostridium] leptum]